MPRIISTQTGNSDTRIVRPAMSSGVRTGFSDSVKSRQPQYQILVSGMMSCFSSSSSKAGCIEAPEITASASSQFCHRNGALGISIAGTSVLVAVIEAAAMSSTPSRSCCTISVS